MKRFTGVLLSPKRRNSSSSSSECKPKSLITHRGVSLAGLEELSKEFLKINMNETKEDTELIPGELFVKYVIKPSTKVDGISYSYIAYLAESDNKKIQKSALGKCNVFVSHAWMHQFPDLIAGIRDWEEQQQQKKCYYYFLDYLAVDQHNPYDDLGSMGSLVRYCEVFLLVLSPWPTPILVSRAWCIFEIGTAIANDKEVNVAITPEDRQKFHNAMMSGSDNVYNVFSTLDSASATCSVPSDLMMIQQWITDEMEGFTKLDNTVGDALRAWLETMVHKTNKSWNRRQMKTRQRAKFLHMASKFMQKQGHLQVAVDFANESVKIRSKLYGSLHKETISAMNRVASCQKALGYVREALTTRRKLLAMKVRMLGPNHPDIFTYKHDLAETLRSMKKRDEALRLSMEILEAQLQIYDEDNPKLVNTKSKVAEGLSGLKRWDESLELQKEVLSQRLICYGVLHPKVLGTKSSIARSLYRLKRYDEAFLLQKEVLAGRIKLFGDGNPKVEKTKRAIRKTELLMNNDEKNDDERDDGDEMELDEIFKKAERMVTQRQRSDDSSCVDIHIGLCGWTHVGR